MITTDSTLVVVPAYGRDYRSKKAAIDDWNAGKDFRVTNYKLGGYINRADALTTTATSIQIRYKNQTMVTVIPNK